MKAAVVRAKGAPINLEDVDVDEPAPCEVVVRTAAAGLCHSDLTVIEGKSELGSMWPYPMVIGHESAGIVEKVGSLVSYVKPGDHVVTCASQFCGKCEACLTGNPHMCRSTEMVRSAGDRPRLSTDGASVSQFANLGSFAEQMLVHENAVVKVPDELPMDLAALLGCGVTTGLGAALNTARVTPGSSVAVVGCGGVGLSIIQGARIAGARQIVAVDRIPQRLEMA
ncbi:MAG: alcohol dehydrogenase catalytic domain-containing protein, partial [Acidimicrobiales bacterium]